MSNLNFQEKKNKARSATQLHQGNQFAEEHAFSASQADENRKRKARTEAEAQSRDGRAGGSGHSSKNHMSHVKAGGRNNPGGGVKAGRHH